ncbi:MAG TPA: AAA family ATPase [Gammaproteobacteria bacterium]|nr:AAA family ATPase [Gammaproteobacteria bacterium]
MPRPAATNAARRQQLLAEALTNPKCYGHDVDKIRLVETHISFVLLTGPYAYKLKKPLKLPFLDFSTRARRRHFCLEELRLNRRLARELYLGVVPIGGSSAAPRVGRKPAIEYAIKMRQFDTRAELDEVLARGELPRAALEQFATDLARFHTALPPVKVSHAAAAIRASALDNFATLERYVRGTAQHDLRVLRSWTERESARLAAVFERRAAGGAHRECHGDLHLKNLLYRDGAVVAFDALEFDRRLREIDVVSEVAFLAMDLCAARRADLAFSFLNRYFEASGDYDGIEVLRFYLVYRALVRAKVDAIKSAQTRRSRRNDTYLRAAVALSAPARPLLLVTHGLSGSGKTHVTNELVARLPALRVRSDLERKRLHGLAALARTASAVGQGLYGAAASRRTYAALAVTADRLLRHGFNAVVDAAFLRRAERLAFRQVAAANGARFAILHCAAPEAELKVRIAQRSAEGRDASEATFAVLLEQLRDREPLDRAERRATVRVATQRRIRYENLLARLAKI